MLLIRAGVTAFLFGLLAPGTAAASDQVYPSKPIRIITGGGGVDVLTRLMAQGISAPLGQPVVTINQAIRQPEDVAAAPPDGHTLLVASSGAWLRSLLEKTSYDPVRDLAPITIAGNSLYVLTVHPSLPVKSIKELIELAKTRPGALNYSTGGLNQPDLVASVLFTSMSGINVVHVSYKDGPTAAIAVISGEVQLSFTGGASAKPIINSGKLKALAVSSSQPSALFPGLPTVAETLPGFELVTSLGVFAPAKTPEAIIIRLNQEMVRSILVPDAKERLASVGIEVVGSSPAQLAARMKSEMAGLSKMIAEGDIKVDK